MVYLRLGPPDYKPPAVAPSRPRNEAGGTRKEIRMFAFSCFKASLRHKFQYSRGLYVLARRGRLADDLPERFRYDLVEIIDLAARRSLGRRDGHLFHRKNLEG